MLSRYRILDRAGQGALILGMTDEEITELVIGEALE
jgi:hypothetical protein